MHWLLLLASTSLFAWEPGRFLLTPKAVVNSRTSNVQAKGCFPKYIGEWAKQESIEFYTEWGEQGQLGTFSASVSASRTYSVINHHKGWRKLERSSNQLGSVFSDLPGSKTTHGCKAALETNQSTGYMLRALSLWSNLQAMEIGHHNGGWGNWSASTSEPELPAS